jgi:hypothetical protein
MRERTVKPVGELARARRKCSLFIRINETTLTGKVNLIMVINSKGKQHMRKYYLSQIIPVYNATVLIKSGIQTLERTDRGSLVVTDGLLTDWIVVYNHNGKWAQDGVLTINKPIVKFLNKYTKERMPL